MILALKWSNRPLFVQALPAFASDPEVPHLSAYGLDMGPETGSNIILTDSTCIVQKTLPNLNLIRALVLRILGNESKLKNLFWRIHVE